MPFDPASFAVSAGTSILGPLVAKGLGSMFGLDQPSGPEQEALARLKNQASGATQSPAQLMLASQRAKTQQTLASLAARGTAQQQAGNVRAAMQAAPEIQQQQAGQLAALRAHEMAQAQQQLAQMQASMGANDRKYMQSLIGAGVSGAAGAGAMAMTQSPDVVKKVAAAVPAPPAPASPSQNDRPYNEGAVDPSTGQAQYRVPKPAADAGLVPMTAASQEAASMARPSASMGPEINIGASNQFTLSPELIPAIGADGGYKSPRLGLGPQAPLAPSLSIGGKQRSKLYGYDPLSFQSQMKLGGGQ